MATKNAQTFIEDLNSDTSLATQLYVAAPTNLDGVIDFAYNKGYVFTIDELEAALKKYPDNEIARQLGQYIH